MLFLILSLPLFAAQISEVTTLNCQRSTILGSEQGKMTAYANGTKSIEFNFHDDFDVDGPRTVFANLNQENDQVDYAFKPTNLDGVEVLVNKGLLTSTNDSPNTKSGTIFFNKTNYSKTVTYDCWRNE